MGDSSVHGSRLSTSNLLAAVRPLERAPVVGMSARADAGADAAEVTAIVELAVQFTGFKNIDLFSQGIYQLRVHAQAAGSKRQGVPFAFATSAAPVADSLPSALISTTSLLPATILDGRGEFCTPAFRIRYCDEEVLSRVVARFRMELTTKLRTGDDGLGGLECEDVILTIRLCHARSTTALNEDGDAEMQSLKLFSAVATQTLRVQTPTPGVTAFFPVTFDDWHFCFAPLLLHSSVLEFKL